MLRNANIKGVVTYRIEKYLWTPHSQANDTVCSHSYMAGGWGKGKWKFVASSLCDFLQNIMILYWAEPLDESRSVGK